MPLLLVSALLFPTSLIAQDQIVKNAHVGVIASQNSFALKIVDSYQKGFSALYASNSNGIMKFCRSLEEAGCANNLTADTVLPICKAVDSPNCIESLSIIDEGLVRRNLVYVRSISIKDGYVYTASPSKGLPEPGQISLWKDEASGGDKYFSLNASLTSKLNKNDSEVSFLASDLSVEINQYVERRENISLGIGPMQGPIAAGWNPPASIKEIECAWHEVGLCGVKQIMDISQKLEVTLRVPNSVSGWVYGRLRNQAVNIEPIPLNQSRITISGSPVEVPGILAEIDYTKDSQLVAEYDMKTRTQRFNAISLPTTQLVLSDGGDSTIFSVFSKILNDRSQYEYTKWSIYTKPFLNVGATSLGQLKFQECIREEKGVQGFVTSNAPIYESSPPSFDGESLNYKVAGTHLKSDGTLFEGSYDLSIKSSLARCIYGFTSAPISATISVVNSEGESKVKTTTFNETKSGWVNFSAAGFTFSSPTIKIRISQEQVAPPAPTSPPAMIKPALKKISCQKKKVIKKISGVNPKCPAGYKKVI
jgi:hypothetical protein